MRNGYVKGQQNDTSPHNFDRNGQAEYKPRRSAVGFSGGSGCYASGTSRSRRDESTGSLSQPKIIFNEDEYTRITTPRQDVLFKKGYLSRKKPWASNTSTSATPSTTESQSASHSTAGRGIGRGVKHFIKSIYLSSSLFFLFFLFVCLFASLFVQTSYSVT